MKKTQLYIIHGWTYTTDPWTKTLEILKKRGLAVEMLHVPGLTTSSKKVWTIEDYVAWADRNIPDGAVALGHSNGGRILLNLCSAKPEKLKHLILLDSAGIYELSKKHSAVKSISRKFSFLKKIPGLAKVWHKLTGASDYGRAPENMKKTLTNMLDSDKNLDPAKVTTPTSILWGEADTITPTHQAEVLHAKIPTSTLEIFPNWTHAPYISHPAELAKAIFNAYHHPPVPAPAPGIATEAAAISASMALRKAPEPEIPSTAPISATLSFNKKANGPAAESAASRSAALAVPSAKAKATSETDEKPTSIVDQLDEVDYERTEPDLPALAPRKVITTASVPKKSRKNRKKLKQAQKSAKSSASAKPSPKAKKGTA